MQYDIKLISNVTNNNYESQLLNDRAVFKITANSIEDAIFSVVFEFEEWQKEDYLLMPACAYNGNRFKSVVRKYPPMFLEDEMGIMPPITITDVPRLELEGSSKIEVTTGDMATPAIGMYLKQMKEGCMIYTTQGMGCNNFGVTFEELTNKCKITITYPVKRESVYGFNYMRIANDKSLKAVSGDVIEIPFNIVKFNADSITIFFEVFFDTRKCMADDSTNKRSPLISFSKAWQIQEKKFNTQNFRTYGGYYGVGTEDSKYQNWQTGWVGGGMSSHALLMEGTDSSKERALSTLDFLFSIQSKAGLFYGIMNKGVIYDDGFDYPGSQSFHLIRKSADALYFVFKHFDLLTKRGEDIKNTWIEGAKKCSDAFVEMWDKYGQWGQFVDVETGEIMVGNSTSAAIAPAALTLAYSFFKDEKYLKTAEAAAEYYYIRDVSKGVMTGGPGEILQCPDSESSFGMLESFVVLYETTGFPKWLNYAKDAANQCSSWCVTYNYNFPQNSEFGRLNVKTTGSVFANVQNKHSAPGICTLSGNALLKLFRATGNIKYLELMSDIGSFIVQCMSREDSPIYSWDEEPQKLMYGFICERVNMSDWEGFDKVGGVFNGSCWSEVSQMLTYAEIPGVYAVKDKKIIQITDHVNAYFNDLGELAVENVFNYKIEVKVMIEKCEEFDKMLGATYENKFKRIKLQPFEVKIVG